MTINKRAFLIFVSICSVFSNNMFASNHPSYDHFATAIKQANTTRPIRLIEDANKKVRIIKTYSKSKSSPMHTSSKSSDQSNDCTVDNLHTLTGDTLITYIADCSHGDIVQSPFFEENEKTEQLFSEANMITIANAIETRAVTYSSEDSMGLAELMLIARAGFYVAFYSDSLNYTSIVNTTFSTATKIFSNNAHFLDIDDEHSIILSEWINLVDGSENWVSAYNDLFVILDHYPTQTIEETTYHGISPLYDVQFAIWRGQNNNSEFYDLINNDEKMVSRYVRLAEDMYAYMGTNNEGAFINILGELGRLLSYSNHTMSAQTAIATLLEGYTRLSAEWLKLAFAINDFGDCAQFEKMCSDDLKPELMDIAFPNTYTFDDGSLVVHTAIGMNKAQALYHAQKQVEAQFKRKNQELEALESDDNEVLTMYVYGTRSDYEQYQPYLFGLDTDNGGIYIESWGQFFTYERTTDESIYTLEELFRHEYVHYLHGRYTVEGSWGETEMYQDSRLTWFEEGGAEFFAGSTQANDVQLRCFSR